MSRPRTMGAGLAGSMTKKVNVNQVQFGDKLQGLAPQATHFFIAGNGKAGWNNYRTRADGDRRNFVFCMNQLGGVGRAKSQFKIDGVNQPDGAQRCVPHPYSIAEQIKTLLDYLRNRFPNYQLAFVEGDASRAELARMMALDLSKINVGSSNMKGLISLVNEQNAHGYLLVTISKDTGYVPKGTYLGLPVYIWTTFGGGNFDVWDGTGDPPTDSGGSVMNPILTATQCVTAAAVNNVEYAGAMDMDSRPYGCWYQPPSDDGATKAAMYWNVASAPTTSCCADGIANGDVCCPSSCGVCGGTDCSSHTGGADCCTGPIKESGPSCVNETDVACVIPSDGTCSAYVPSSGCSPDYPCVYQGVRAPYSGDAPGGSTGWTNLTGGTLGGPDTDGFPVGPAINFYIEPSVSNLDSTCGGTGAYIPMSEMKYRLLDGKGNVLGWDKSDLRVSAVYNLALPNGQPQGSPPNVLYPGDNYWTIKNWPGSVDHMTLAIQRCVDSPTDGCPKYLPAGKCACPSAEGVPCSGAWGPDVDQDWPNNEYCNCGACDTAAPCCTDGVISQDGKTCCAKECTACGGTRLCRAQGRIAALARSRLAEPYCVNADDVACIIPEDEVCTAADPDCTNIPGGDGTSAFCSQAAKGSPGCPQCPTCGWTTQKWCAYGVAGPANNGSKMPGSIASRMIFGDFFKLDYGVNDSEHGTSPEFNDLSGMVVEYYYAYDEIYSSGRFHPQMFYANVYYDDTGSLKSDTVATDLGALYMQPYGPAWEPNPDTGDPELTAPLPCVTGRVTAATVNAGTDEGLFFCLS